MWYYIGVDQLQIEPSFNTFNPRGYLGEYYTKIASENENLLRFFVKAYKGLPQKAKLLEFGGGPTIYQLISAAKEVDEIHFSDYLEANLAEIRLWQSKSSASFDWTIFIKRTLEIEGEKNITEEKIRTRENLLRRKITELLHCDAFKDNPLGKKYHQAYYDIVSVNFVPDSITFSRKDWQKVVLNILSLLKEQTGVLIMSALKEADYWRVGNKYFPAVKITEDDLNLLLIKSGFKVVLLETIAADVVDEKSPDYEGYKGMIFSKAVRNA